MDHAVIPTSDPASTLRAAADFFRSASRLEAPGAPDLLGIGCFGPVDLRPSSPSFGHITSTPKPGWRNVDVAGFFRRELGLAPAFDTDVNAAAYGEFLWGAAAGITDFVYLTIGTGIGGGIFSNGIVVHGLGHPELGHIKVRRVPGDEYPGCCPFHRDCLEGLASGPAIEARWGAKGQDLEDSHPAWELEARYLSQAIACYELVLSPELVLLGGGVGLRPGLAERVRKLVGEELSGYIPQLAETGRIDSLVARPELGAEAGLYGAAALALRARRD